ncbi:hypothetical protein JI58_05280 [Marinosulfonomonas sp. PRT-SC04]|nr:hypothetical protein JI58_05280 [Marinosulfonomonas sp. PRT-SC04]
MTDIPNTNPQTADIRDLKLDQIDVRDRFRGVDEVAAKLLAFDIAKNGLTQFIMVRPVADNQFKLVVGGHRFRAHQILELEEIRCEVRNLTDEEAHLIEIGENLLRRDLTTVDHLRSLLEWDTSMKKEHPELRRGGDRKSADAIKVQSLDFDKYTELMAEKTGRSRSSNFDNLKVARVLGDDLLKQLSGTAIEDNMAQLKALANLPPAKRPDIVELLVSDEIKTIAEGEIKLSDQPASPELSPRDAWLKKIKNQYFQGSMRDQKAFLKEIGAVLK